MQWFTSDNLPTSSGWYLIAINPDNHDTLETDILNRWRTHFGCSMAYFALATGKFNEPSMFYEGGRDVTPYTTHWAYMPNVPQL